VLVAAGDVGGGEHLRGTALDAAVAGLHVADSVALDGAEAEIVADGAGFLHGEIQYRRCGGRAFGPVFRVVHSHR
jgi:hypothetical protein